MYILKIGLTLLAGIGFGFGVDKISDSETLPDNENYYYGYMEEESCHSNGDILEHMLENLSDEELILIQEKIDELLVEYSITLEELNDNFDVRYEIMSELIVFFDENEIDYHNHGIYHNHNYEDNWYGGMGMH